MGAIEIELLPGGVGVNRMASKVSPPVARGAGRRKRRTPSARTFDMCWYLLILVQFFRLLRNLRTKPIPDAVEGETVTCNFF
jgi:hypothetical protein